MFWEENWEKIDNDRLADFQMEKLNDSIRAAAGSPFYRNMLKRTGLRPKINSIEEIREFPFTVKDDLRKSYPFGMVCVETDRLIRLHGSSGTTGRPTLVLHTRKDIETWANLMARCLYMVGSRKSDVLQNMMSYGLFTGGLGIHYGAEKIGILVIPMGTGNTERQLAFFKDLETSIIHITPSYCLYLGHVMEEMDLKPGKDFNIRIAIMGAEPYSEATRRKLEGIFGFHAYNCYGMSEMNGPGVAFECAEQNGMHLWEDHFFAEIIDPETGEVLPDGTEGELVLTTLQREGMPLIRYRTRDLTRMMKGHCKCGRPHRRIERIKGRSDDMFIVKGVNVFPSQIETVLMETPEVDKNFLIVLDRKEGLDVLTVQVEIRRSFFTGDMNQLRDLQEKLRERLKSVTLISPVVEMVEPGTIPPSTGKAKRVVDNRRL